MTPSAFNPPASLFLPLAVALGWTGTRTALQQRKLWGHGRNRELIGLILLVWLPLLLWFLAVPTGAGE